MLITKANIQPGEVVLVWRAAGGLGVFALQICKMMGAKAIAVVSSNDKFKMCEDLGAVGVINRKDFPNLPYKKNETEEEFSIGKVVTEDNQVCEDAVADIVKKLLKED